MELLIAVPYKLALNHEKALKCKEIKQIVDENQNFFGGGQELQKDLILTIFLMFEW
jgi:hypothetical protein